MPDDVQKVVLLPRFTAFSGARTHLGTPMGVRAFGTATIMLWTGVGTGTSPVFELQLQHSHDLTLWEVLDTLTPTPGTELVVGVGFSREWLRLAVTLTGTDPAFTCWCVGNFVRRAPRPS